MRVFTTHLWKEWREHRAVLLGILVAMPVLTAATFVGFASFGAELANGAAVFTGGAAAMTALALSVELFAGEVTRRTLGFWRRQPGGLAVGGLAKVSMLVLAVSVATGWGGLCFWTACRTFVGAKAAQTAWASLSTPEYALAVPFLSLVLASWVLLTSTWVARGAAAVGIALLLLGAIAFPGWLLWGDRTAFLRTLVPGATLIVVAGIGVPLALAALSLRIGRRLADRPVRAAITCVLLLAGVASGGYARANAQLERWLDVTPSDAGTRVTSATIGRGGRLAYVTVARIEDDAVSRPFIVDLETGAARALGSAGTWLSPMLDELLHGEPLRGIDVIELAVDAKSAGAARRRLLDGATGCVRFEAPYAPTEERELECMRSALRASTPVRTLDGRRAWALARRSIAGRDTDGNPMYRSSSWIERETAQGDVETVPMEAIGVTYVAKATPWGWEGMSKSDYVFIPADVRAADDVLARTVGGHWVGPDRIDAHRSLRRRRTRTPNEVGGWEIADARTNRSIPAPGLRADDRLVFVDGGRAFIQESEQGGTSSTPERFVIVRLDDGRREVVPAFPKEATLAPTDWLRFVGLSPAGRIVVSEVGYPGVRTAWFELDRETGRCLRFAAAPVTGFDARAIPDDDTLIVASYESAGPTTSTVLHRVRFDTGKVERVFPR